MSDVAFTPKSRGGLLADRIAWTAGARTQDIVLADGATYGLAGKRQDGALEVVSKTNMPFVGRFRINIDSPDFDFGIFHVPMPVKKALTDWVITTNVVTVTGAGSDDGLKIGQTVRIASGSFVSAPAGVVDTLVVITAVTATTFSFSLATANVSLTTEAGNMQFQDVELIEIGGGGGSWSDTDTATNTCFFERDGDLHLRNRSGASLTYVMENVGSGVPNRAASPDPNPRITELQGPIT